MNSPGSNDNVVSRLASQSDAIGRLAQNTGGFAAVVAAFESKDPDAFRWVLDRLEMLPYCELICHWVRVKMCVLRCFEICGPPPENVEIPSLEKFANAAVRLASNEKLLRRIVDAVSCGDGDAYRAAIQDGELREFCHLICHWVCSIIYRRVCEVVCQPASRPVNDAASEIRASGRVIASLLANKKAFGAISEAAVALDCVRLQSSIDEAGFGPNCEVICCFICLWRCVWACREVCGVRRPEPTGVYGIEEARAFALAARQLATQPRALGDLVSAVAKRDAKSYSEIVSRLGLGPYCYQLCAWVCAGICYEFCICVCPPSAFPPLFDQVGNFDIYAQIDPTTGLTNTQLALTAPMPFGGGPNFAFFEQLQLGGWCPATSPISPGTPMMFRFLYARNLTTLAGPITSAAQTTLTVSSNAGIPPTPFNISVCYSDVPYQTAEIMTVNIATTTTWTVVRGVDGSTAAASIPAGATVAINPTPITGPLVDTPIQVGQRPILWPNPTLIGSSTILEPVYVGPGTDPLPPSVLPWYPPAHYIQPDVTTGWVDIDTTMVAPGVSIFLWFDSAQVTTASCELLAPPCFGTPGGAPAGTAVPPANQGVGTDLTIIFQASRVGVTAPVDYSNSLCKIHVNNFPEVNNLWFVEFDTPGTTCCTPINSFLSTRFTVDHEMIGSGGWSLSITSCSPSAPGTITPSVSTSPQATTLTSSIDNVVTSIPVASVAGFPSSPFILVVGTETMVVTSVSPGVFTVVRGEGGTSAAAPLGATAKYPGLTLTARGGAGTVVEDTSAWTNCSYQAWLSARAGLTSGLLDNDPGANLLTFCICGHGSTPAPAAVSQAKKR